MKIVKTPLRVSLFGGGCDLPDYFSQRDHGAIVISMAINKYMYLVHNQRPTGGYRLSYSEVEELSSLTTAQHTIIAQAAKDYGDLEPCTLTIVSDLPKGTGLGSSSALAVCAYQLFRRTQAEHAAGMAYAAYQLERQVSNCGVQDHLPAAFGGFNVYHIDTEGRATAKPLPSRYSEMVDTYGLLLYTGQSRPADNILKTWKQSVDHLDRLYELARYVEHELDRLGVEELAGLLHIGWGLKRVIGGVGSDALNAQYHTALDAGAMGGKLLGAGGGGCWFFLVKPDKRQAVIDAMGLIEIPFRVECRGVTDAYV
jgi:D-glycero-alpha-D-manno-heptose-7-phosphate kinase